jgi:hypothetical protein
MGQERANRIQARSAIDVRQIVSWREWLAVFVFAELPRSQKGIEHFRPCRRMNLGGRGYNPVEIECGRLEVLHCQDRVIWGSGVWIFAHKSLVRCSRFRVQKFFWLTEILVSSTTAAKSSLPVTTRAALAVGKTGRGLHA